MKTKKCFQRGDTHFCSCISNENRPFVVIWRLCQDLCARRICRSEYSICKYLHPTILIAAQEAPKEWRALSRQSPGGLQASMYPTSFSNLVHIAFVSVPILPIAAIAE